MLENLGPAGILRPAGTPLGQVPVEVVSTPRDTPATRRDRVNDFGIEAIDDQHRVAEIFGAVALDERR